ncbi:isoprenoid synthase domain-containing protein [Lasiosphaeria hispida]|uniref:Terpene synthase n=1 Tax=Lasiosphaeria hispida TaxID=260671 RepID=A0AAJ0H8Y8_9PEZI|nr:isoprenoid synthase domain-containing protein [Lasiosphaeria hispida]
MSSHTQEAITHTPPTPSHDSRDLDTVCVQIPDLFSSIMATPLRVNPHYFPNIREEGYERIKTLMKKDDSWSAKNASIELGFLCSTWAPTANADALRTLFDYNHWVFLFDDQFDEGHLKSDVVAALGETSKMSAIMEGSLRVTKGEGMNPIEYLWQTVCDRVRQGSSEAVYGRFKELHRHYFDGLLLQVADTQAGHPSTRSVEDYLIFRVRTIGVFPAFPISEYAEGVDIPAHAYSHPSIQEVMRISAEMVILVNDIASFKKDQVMGVDFNIINVLQRTEGGMSIQQALDRISTMLDDCYQRWYRALAGMPIWGKETDYQVLRYIDICRDVALGCLHWSFMTPRYLGEAQGREVRRTKKLWLLGKLEGSDHPIAALDRERKEMASLYAGIAIAQ